MVYPVYPAAHWLTNISTARSTTVAAKARGANNPARSDTLTVKFKLFQFKNIRKMTTLTSANALETSKGQLFLAMDVKGIRIGNSQRSAAVLFPFSRPRGQTGIFRTRWQQASYGTLLTAE
jgi:hypothetical protein